ncbi:MAG: hypothetical protein IPG93_10040 [Burkholderiales bacterium]|nr:hypothetical protein [Burkholderiales bacterium]
MNTPDSSCILKFAAVWKNFLLAVLTIRLRRAAALALVDAKIIVCDARIALCLAHEKWSSIAKRPTKR